MYTIYKITNIKNQKSYIGFDSNWPARKAVHICEAITRKNKQYPLYRAIQKYGVENFKWEILYQSDDHDHTLNVIENKFIVEHNTHFRDGHGYNMTYGGEGTKGWVPSEETKKKISEANKGRVSSNKGKKCPWTSEMNKNRKGTKNPNRQKEYQFIDPQGHTHHIKGLVDFCKQYNLAKGCMSQVFSGQLKQYKGWRKAT